MFGEDLFFWFVVDPSLILGVSAFLLLYWLSSRNHDYWKKRGIPYCKPLPFVGSLYENLTNKTHEIEIKRYFKFGPIYGQFEGSRPQLSVADPTLLRDILVKDFHLFSDRPHSACGDPVADNLLLSLKGEVWKRVRSIVTPIFSSSKLKRVVSMYDDCARTLQHNIATTAKDGKSIDAHKFYSSCTMDGMASAVFSIKIDSHNDPDNPFWQSTKDKKVAYGNRRGYFLFIMFPILKKLFKVDLFQPSTLRLSAEAARGIIELRRKTGQKRNDIMQILMDTSREGADDPKEEQADDPNKEITSNYGEDTNQLPKRKIYKHLSMNELVSQCAMFVQTGNGLISIAMACTTYLLALNQDKQDILRKEVDEVIKEFNGDITYESVHKMKYLDNAISESLRIFSPVSKTIRVAAADYKLGDTGIIVPKGMAIHIPICAIHKDPTIYPEPERFEPDRFTPEEKAKRSPYAFLPFGSGPRNCLAMRFSLILIKVCLANVIANFKIKPCSETKIPLDFSTGKLTLEPNGMILDFEIRNDSPLAK